MPLSDARMHGLVIQLVLEGLVVWIICSPSSRHGPNSEADERSPVQWGPLHGELGVGGVGEGTGVGASGGVVPLVQSVRQFGQELGEAPQPGEVSRGEGEERGVGVE